MIDVAEAIDVLGRALTRTTTAAGAYGTDGKFTPGAQTVTAIRGVIQPIKGRELRDLPEGIRDEADFVVWTRAELATDDTLTFSAGGYRVLKVWPRPDGGFTRAAVAAQTG